MATTKTASTLPTSHGQGLRTYYQGKIEEYEVQIREKQVDLRRMEAQRNELNTKGMWVIDVFSLHSE
jgi:26S proteasome regulatory subunit T6